MWKKLASVVLVLTLISLFTITAAEAGSRKRHIWPGAGIALGALALGGLLAHQLYAYPPPPPPFFLPPPPAPRRYQPPPPPPEYAPGRWEIIREWVPGQWEKVWIPGHYDRFGNWVTGHYEKRQTPGHYVKQRVWVEGYYRYN